MKIAFLYKFFPSSGGVERVMTILANELTRVGYFVRIYSFRQCLEAPAYPLNNNVEIFHLPDKSKINSINNVKFLVEAVNSREFDILFNHDSTFDSMSLCNQVKKEIAVKIITLHHGQIYLPVTSLKSIARKYSPLNPRNSLFPFYLVYDYIKRSVHHMNNIHISDVYVLLSDSYRRQLGNSPKLRVIPNPLSFETFYPMEEYRCKENLVIMVGRLSETDKRFSLALQIWERIESYECFNNWNFEIVGDGNDRLFVESIIKDKKLKRVSLIGHANPEPYYKRAKILMMTSAFEGFPLVLLEAAQYACVPIVMNSFETLHEIINDGINGIIVKNNDIISFTKVLMSLMNSPKKIENIAAGCIENSKQYAPSFLISKWIELFKELKK